MRNDQPGHVLDRLGEKRHEYANENRRAIHEEGKGTGFNPRQATASSAIRAQKRRLKLFVIYQELTRRCNDKEVH